MLGAGDIADADDADVCLSAVRSLLDAWNVDPQAATGLAELTHTPAAGVASFTIGPAGDVVAAQPLRIDSAVYRSDSIDTQIDVVSLEEYAALPLKSVQGPPECVALNRGSDTATVYLYPASQGYQLRLLVQNPVVSGFATLVLTDSLTLPSGLRNALEWNVAEEVKNAFSVDPQTSAEVARKAANALRKFKRGNVRVPQLGLPGKWPDDYEIEVA